MCTIVFWKTLHNCAKRCAFSKGPAEIRHSFFNRAAEKDRQSRLLGQRALQQSSGLLTGPKLSLLGAYWLLSCSRRVWLCAALWTVAHQAPLSIGFSRQEYWSGLPFPSPGIFPTQRSNLGLPHCRQISDHLSHQGRPRRQKLLFVYCRRSHYL